mmetsp:Transcript_32726/g.53074  ORF Transcript_32726/g.53074 Transcript_32726/m.53074 type:complete len:1588 (+) Transcript_32726:28-4791(+)
MLGSLFETDNESGADFAQSSITMRLLGPSGSGISLSQHHGLSPGSAVFVSGYRGVQPQLGSAVHARLMRPEHGFVGLENQGATCYLNSLLQTMYMTPELRSSLYEIPVRPKGGHSNPISTSSNESKDNEMSLLSSPAMAELLSMGFPMQSAKAALTKFPPHGSDTSSALEWLLDGGATDAATLSADGTMHGPWLPGQAAPPAPMDSTAQSGGDDAKGNDEESSREQLDIPSELQRLFAYMDMSEEATVSTENLTRSFGWRGTEAMQQQDVCELNRILIDALDESLKGSLHEKLVDTLYKGVLVNQVQCLKCLHISEREESVMDVPLVVKGFKSVAESLASFVQYESLDGDNQYFCERCGCKVDARKRVTFRSLPPILTLSLRRFEYDWVKDARVKINSVFAFPLELDMSQYCNDPSASASLSTSTSTPCASDPSPLLYDLLSVIIHSGGPYSGHFHAYIRDMFPTHRHQSPDPDHSSKQVPGSLLSPSLSVHDPSQPHPASEHSAPSLSLSSVSNSDPSTSSSSHHDTIPAKSEPQSQASEGPSHPTSEHSISNLHHDKGGRWNGESAIFIALGGGKWYDFDDTRVKTIQESALEGQFGGRGEGAYMLVYRSRAKVLPDTPPPVPPPLFDEVCGHNETLQKDRAKAELTAHQCTFRIYALDTATPSAAATPPPPPSHPPSSGETTSDTSHVLEEVEWVGCRYAVVGEGRLVLTEGPATATGIGGRVKGFTTQFAHGYGQEEATMYVRGDRRRMTLSRLRELALDALGVPHSSPFVLQPIEIISGRPNIDRDASIYSASDQTPLKDLVSDSLYKPLLLWDPASFSWPTPTSDSEPPPLEPCGDEGGVGVGGKDGVQWRAVFVKGAVAPVAAHLYDQASIATKAIKFPIENDAMTLRQLKEAALQSLFPNLTVDPRECRLRRTTAGGMAGAYLLDESSTLKGAGVRDFDLLVAEAGNEPFPVSSANAPGSITLRFILDAAVKQQGAAVADAPLEISLMPSDTVKDCKERLGEIVGLEADRLTLRRTNMWEQPSAEVLVDETQTLDRCNLRHDDVLYVHYGTAIVAGHISVQMDVFGLLSHSNLSPDLTSIRPTSPDPSTSSTPTRPSVSDEDTADGHPYKRVLPCLRRDLVPMDVTAHMTLGALKEAVSSTYRVPHDTPLHRVRIREVINESVGRVYRRNDFTLRRLHITNGKHLAVQIVDDDTANMDRSFPHAQSYFLCRRHPPQKAFSPLTEVNLPFASNTSITVPDLYHHIRHHLFCACVGPPSPAHDSYDLCIRCFKRTAIRDFTVAKYMHHSRRWLLVPRPRSRSIPPQSQSTSVPCQPDHCVYPDQPTPTHVSACESTHSLVDPSSDSLVDEDDPAPVDETLQQPQEQEHEDDQEMSTASTHSLHSSAPLLLPAQSVDNSKTMGKRRRAGVNPGVGTSSGTGTGTGTGARNPRGPLSRRKLSGIVRQGQGQLRCRNGKRSSSSSSMQRPSEDDVDDRGGGGSSSTGTGTGPVSDGVCPSLRSKPFYLREGDILAYKFDADDPDGTDDFRTEDDPKQLDVMGMLGADSGALKNSNKTDHAAKVSVPRPKEPELRIYVNRTRTVP